MLSGHTRAVNRQLDLLGIPFKKDRRGRDVLRTIESDHAADIEHALLEGIRSGPRTSAGFIKLVFEYRLGKPPREGRIGVEAPHSSS